jgi:phage shock protein C
MEEKYGSEGRLMSAHFKKLRRIPERGVVAGVCAGIAEYFGWNVKLLRALLVIGVIFSGFFPVILAYCVLWYAMDPVSPEDYAGSFTEPAGGGTPTRPATMSEIKARFERLDERLRSIEECVTDKEFELRRELKKLEV